MSDLGIRISGPYDIALRVEDLILLLHGIQKERGNIWCSIYSADKQQHVPLLLSSVNVTGTVRFAAQVGTVVDEMQFDLLEQNADLRRQLAECRAQLANSVRIAERKRGELLIVEDDFDYPPSE